MFFNLETTAVAPAAGDSMLTTVLMLAIMFAIMYFMVIRPENKRKKAEEEMQSGIKVGDEVTTYSGIIGKVVSIKDDKIVIETGADQVRIEMKKQAIGTNETAVARAEEEAKKEKEAAAKAKAAKKAEKQ
jgi:preprotein translocase subunit YajC